jgi:exodeoxyribonuclease III
MANYIKLISWNVNGFRSVLKKGFHDWVLAFSPDILCLQETKIQEDQLTPDMQLPGYESYWSCAVKKGYSGVAVYTKIKPKAVSKSMDMKSFDDEGRVLRLDFADFSLFNVYFPNGKMSPERLKYKMDFYNHFLEMLEKLRSTCDQIVFVGDVNTAHNEIDIARPKENSKISGFLPIERAWMDKLVAAGYCDTFRRSYPDVIQYSWWDLKTGARQRNVGWRLDYVFTTKELFPRIKASYILPEVLGSDHCPVGVDIAVG